MTLCCFAPLLCASVFFWQIKRSKANQGPAGSVAAILNEHIWGNTDVCDCSAWFFSRLPYISRHEQGVNRVHPAPLCVTSPKRVALTPWTQEVGRRVVSPHEWSAMKKTRLRSFLCPHILLPAAAPARAVICSGDSPVEYLRCLSLPNVHR